MLLVNVSLLATRRMTSSGAMTCPICRYISQPTRMPQSWESTNLSLIQDRQEDIHNGTFTPRCDNQQRAHSENGTRLNEHGDDGLGQSTNSGHPQGRASVSGVYGEPDDDHEGEEDVE